MDQGQAEIPLLASFSQRFLAYILDQIILFIPLTLSIANLIYLKSISLLVITSLGVILYRPLLEWQIGGTLGKLVLKLKVVSNDFTFIDLKQSINRYLIFFGNVFYSQLALFNMYYSDTFRDVTTMEQLQEITLPNPTFVDDILIGVILISATFIIFDPMRRALHDQLASTLVIQTKENHRNN